jgi:integrase
MGRQRKRDRHLPPCMYLKHGAYYFQHPKTREWKNLGPEDQLGAAITKYGELIGGQWSGRTLGDVIDRYRVEVLPLKGERARVDQQPYLDKLRRAFGHMLPDNVTPQHCYGYIDARRTKDGKPAPSAAWHEISLLGHVFAKAIRWGLGIGNPVRQLDTSEKPKPKARTYLSDERLNAVRACATERMDCAIEGALLTGLRRGDLLGLTRANVTDEGIVVQTSKTGVPLLIERTAALTAWIDRCKRLTPQVPGTYLIRTRDGDRYTVQGFAANWKRTVEKAVEKSSIEPFPFKDIRAKNSDDTDDIAEASERLGHRSIATTRKHYRTKPIRVRPLR